MAATKTFVPHRLYQIPLDDLRADPNQPRKFVDPQALDELTASVKEHGVITPIAFRTENGVCVTIAGEMRCMAARNAGLPTIPGVFFDSPNYEEIALIENMVRANLTAVEEAEALDRLQQNHGYTQEAMAKIMGKTQGSISQTLSLTRLPQAVRDTCRTDPSVPKRVLIEIAAKKNEPGMVKAFAAYQASVNPQKKAKAASAVTDARRVIEAMETARKRLEDLDVSGLIEGEVEALVAGAVAMKEICEAFIAAMGPAAAGETPGEIQETSSPAGPSGEEAPQVEAAGVEAEAPASKKKKNLA